MFSFWRTLNMASACVCIPTKVCRAGSYVFNPPFIFPSLVMFSQVLRGKGAFLSGCETLSETYLGGCWTQLDNADTSGCQVSVRGRGRTEQHESCTQDKFD